MVNDLRRITMVFRILLGLSPMNFIAVLASPLACSGSDLVDQTTIVIADTVLTVPSSIDASGALDVTRVLNDFFRTVPDGSVVSFPA